MNHKHCGTVRWSQSLGYIPAKRGCLRRSASLDRHTVRRRIGFRQQISSCCTMSAPSRTPSPWPRSFTFRRTTSIPSATIYLRSTISKGLSCLRRISDPSRSSPNRSTTSQPSSTPYHLYPSGVVLSHPVRSPPLSTTSQTLRTFNSVHPYTGRPTNPPLPSHDRYAEGSASSSS